jgi:hypothetical protein
VAAERERVERHRRLRFKQLEIEEEIRVRQMIRERKDRE